MATSPTSAAFEPELDTLLAPIAHDLPAGPSLRYDAAFAQIGEAREEDDSTLPMGEWTRPLKKADWYAVEASATFILRTRSKDIQVAFWLTEAWLHLHGVPGLTAGAQLVSQLLSRFWKEVHPVSDGDDHDSRIAPFIWANDTLAQALLLNVRLMNFPDLVPPYVTLDSWQRAVAGEFGVGGTRAGAPPKGKEPVVTGPPTATRQEILDEAGRNLVALVDLDEQVMQATAAWAGISVLLDEQLNGDVPSLSKVAGTLSKLHLAMRSLLQNRDPRDRIVQQPDPQPPESDVEVFEVPSPMTEEIPLSLPSAQPADNVPPTNAASVRIASRDDAYLLLELAAAYLKRMEPHSPTPYLVSRAVTWGRMPLPELMQEVLREEGDLNRYFSMLGVRAEG